MYGSSLMLVTRMLRDSRIAAREAAAMPFPSEETTPPVTKTYFAIYLRRVGMGQFTRFPRSLQNRSTFCRRFPSVGERAMKAIPVVALSALIAAFAGAERASAASAAGRTFDFRNARPMLEV